MRLHLSLMVLATIVWTTLLDGSCAGLTRKQSSDRMLEDVTQAYGTKVTHKSHRNTAAERIESSPEGWKDEPSSLPKTTVARIMAQDASVDSDASTDTGRTSPTADVVVATQIAPHGTDKKTASGETRAHDHYYNEDTVVSNFHPQNSRNDCNSISTRKNAIVPHVANRAENRWKIHPPTMPNEQKITNGKIYEPGTMKYSRAKATSSVLPLFTIDNFTVEDTSMTVDLGDSIGENVDERRPPTRYKQSSTLNVPERPSGASVLSKDPKNVLSLANGTMTIRGKSKNRRDIDCARSNMKEREFHQVSTVRSESAELHVAGRTEFTYKNKSPENEITPREKFRVAKNNADNVGVTDTGWKTSVGSSPGRLVDNPVNPDSARENRIFRRLVRNPVTGSEMKNRHRKTLIARLAAKEVNLHWQTPKQRRHPRDQMTVEQQRKNRKGKIFAEMDSIEKDGLAPVIRENQTMTLENSRGFLSAGKARPNNSRLNSISSVTSKRKRKIKFSEIRLNGTRSGLKIKKARRGGLIFLIPARPLARRGFSPSSGITDEGVKDYFQRVKVMEKNPVNFIETIDRSVATGTTISRTSPLTEQYPGSYGPNNYQDNPADDGTDPDKSSGAFGSGKYTEKNSKSFSERAENISDVRRISGDDEDGTGNQEHENNEPADVTKSMNPLIKILQASGGIIRVEVSEVNGNPVVNVHQRSLERPSGKAVAIDGSQPEARVRRAMHQENGRILGSNEKSIFTKSDGTNNYILAGKRVAYQPSRSGSPSDPDSSTSNPPDENLGDSSATYPDDSSPESTSRMSSQTPIELQTPSSNSERSDNLSRRSYPSFGIRNNAVDSLRPWEKLGTHVARGTSSPSFGDGLRTSIGDGKRTKSSISSTKTDSVTGPIDEPLYQAGYFMEKVLLSHSESGSSVTSRPTVGSSSNALTDPIRSRFTSEKSTFVPVMGSRRFYRDASSGTVVPLKLANVKSRDAIPETTVVTGFGPSRIYSDIIETVGSSKSVGNRVRRRSTGIQAVALSNESPVTSATGHHNATLVKPSDRKNLFTSMGLESGNLQNSRNKQAFENATIVTGASNKQTSNNHTNDNSTRTAASFNQWPVKYSAIVEGDLVLGGLMMVHEREDSVTCGPVMPQGGVQALEAMLYTLDWVNERDLVPGVGIGAHILDDCDKDTYGLEMAVDFIKGSISNIDGAEYHCNKTTVRKVISGVVGAASSVTSIQVANLLRLFRIPQVSFFSTSPELSNKMRFEYFTRTIPSDHYQVKAMVDIVRSMGWSYVSIIYEESNYGEKAYEELETLLGKHHICIAVKEKLSKDSGVAQAHVYDNIVLKLLKKPMARGCIIFASDQEVAGVMRAVRRCNATGAFSWIGSDGWSARSLVSDGNEPEVEGTLSVQPQANPVEGFEDYFLNLTVENNRRNPWFVEFWEDHFKCRYPNATQTPYNNYTKECTTTERLTKQNTAFENQLQFVSDAVMAFAYAFRKMHADLCHGNRGLCDAMKPTKGTELLSYLRKVQFKGLSGDVFRFDKNGDGPARYNIIHFKQISPGNYKWIRVGKYLEGELRLNMSDIQFRLGHPQPPESVCSLPCEVGQAKKYVEGESCCWHCFNCTQYQIRHKSDERQCVLCPQGTVPDDTHSYCRDIPENFLRPESGWAIGAMSFSSTGILITLFVGGVFLKHNDTPIVRASGRELSYVLLTGILLCYLVTFALVLRPNDIVCSIQRFSAGFCFTVVYAALLTKTNRISRIFNAGKHSAKRPSFISPRSQLIICSMLVAVQILINGVWMVIDPARAMHHYPTREDNLLVCNSYIDASYMIAFTYPIILIVVCTVYAVLTRKIPEAFNESKHIGFTMYTTCVIWLAFVPLYFATGSQVALRITSMSVTISLSASVTIACLFTPKLYIILIHPERNVRPNMMMTRYNTTKGSVVTATNASSMMAPVTLTAATCDQNKAVKKLVITTTDCSTQSEQLEMEVKEPKSDKISTTVTTRSTQTHLNNNAQDCGTIASPVITDIVTEKNIPCAKGLNTTIIGNGPLTQNEVPL